jgi:hypothetical protein
MAIENKISPVGTGMQGASTHNGAGQNIPTHVDSEPNKGPTKVDQVADHAAAKAGSRQYREDPSIFTK